MIKRTVLCAAAITLLSACGQHAATRNHSYITPAPVASVPGTEQNAEERNAIPAASMAPLYGSTSCNGGAPVWVNERTHVYHVQGDPFFGRTKQGHYMCKADAIKEGDREARTSH